VGVATREEAEILSEWLQKQFNRVRFYVEEGWNDDFYISVISDPEYTPDIKSMLPSGWKMLPWANPDQRGELTLIYKE